jgi:predicted DNA-binding protein (MmcQ/YjbR family)
MAQKKNPKDAALEELRAFGLSYPGAHTKSPWPGHLDLAVKDKTFAYLSLPGEPLSISCKLPQSSDEALTLPFTEPTAYGLGKSGWVSATFADDQVPVDLLKQWIDESYRAQAPKRLSAGLAVWGESEPAPVRVAPPRPAAKQRVPTLGVKRKTKRKTSSAQQAPSQRAARKRRAGAAGGAAPKKASGGGTPKARRRQSKQT